MEIAFVAIAVAGFAELVKRAFDRDWRAAIIITGSTSIGALAGFFTIEGLTIVTGMIAGLAASGLVTVASRIGSPRAS